MNLRSTALLLHASLAALLLFTACGKPSQKVKRIARKEPATLANEPPEEQFRQGRSKISQGEYEEAAQILRRLDESGKAPNAIRDWVTLNAGMAELLAGREEESRPLFAKLAEGASGPGEVGRMPKFFRDVGNRMSADKPIPTKIASEYDRFNYEALALFLYGLKNEALGEFDDAMTFFRQFTTGKSESSEPWLGFNTQMVQLRKLALNLCEYEELVDAATKARRASSGSTEANKAMNAARVVRNRIKHSGKLIAGLDDKLGLKVQMTEEQAGADAEVFPAAKEKYEKLMAQHEFADARYSILEAKLSTEEAKREQEILSTKAGHLEQFKFYLVLELANEGYDNPIQLKDGTTIAGGVEKLDDKHVHVREAGGVKLVPWSEVSPESIYAIAKSLISPDEQPSAAALRKWNLGNYAAFIGKKEEGRALLMEAVKANPEYAPDVEFILNSEADGTARE